MCQPNGEVIITNDGATILNKMNVTQPAAKMLVELAKAQVRSLPWPMQTHYSRTLHTISMAVCCSTRRKHGLGEAPMLAAGPLATCSTCKQQQ